MNILQFGEEEAAVANRQIEENRIVLLERLTSSTLRKIQLQNNDGYDLLLQYAKAVSYCLPVSVLKSG